MKNKSRTFSFMYLCVLLLFTAYVMLDTFVIPRTYKTGSAAVSAAQSSSNSAESAVQPADTTQVSDTTQVADAITASSSLVFQTERVNDTTVYVAAFSVSDIKELKAAFADDTYGKNIKEKTSTTAAANNATLAINGDFYGARDSGYVIRNGFLYRDTPASSDQEDLVIGTDGSFKIITEGSVTAQELLDQGAWQVLSFGPALVENGEVTVSANDEVGKAMESNPRTAVGLLADGRIVFVTADGRTNESSGLSLSQLAQYMKSLGALTAYNLDGGGSTTMYYNGSVVNKPTTNGSISERSVSDILYI